jgi:hypothetical protein
MLVDLRLSMKLRDCSLYKVIVKPWTSPRAASLLFDAAFVGVIWNSH